MTPEALDPRRQKMVAALYGELAPEEEEAFRAALAEDDALRAEWEELQMARSFLKRAEAEESEATFEFLMPEEATPIAPWVEAAPQPAPNLGASAKPSLGERLLGWMRQPAAGFAAAAAVLAIMVLAGFRVDHTPSGLVIRFGQPAQELAAVRQEPALSPAPGIRDRGIPTSARRVDTQIFSDQNDPAGYITRAEFLVYLQRLVEMTDTRFAEVEQRMNAETGTLVRGLFEALDEQQQRNRIQFAGEIEKVWMGLIGLSNQNLEFRDGSQSLNPMRPDSREPETPLDEDSSTGITPVKQSSTR